MIRFIINFVVFGFLFYLIYLFLPETFQTLVSWVSHIFDFVKVVYTWAVEQINHAKG